jgi:imidazolonepropionase-like amidohydrolase
MRAMRNIRTIFGSFLLVLSVPMPVIAAEESLVLTAARVYTAPDAEPLKDGVIVIRDGRIAAVGTNEEADVPGKELASGCNAGVVLAGFQNSHVHFIGDGFFEARSKNAAALSGEIERMLTSFGYTTVVDTTSALENTQVIRRRIQSGEISGPRILTVGGGVFPPAGLPVYISHLPRKFLDAQLMPESAAAARRLVSENLEHGADATKLFVATPQSDRSLKRMSLGIARASAEVTHAQNKLVMVHPTDLEGIRLALAAKADVLVHTTLGEEAPWPEDVLQQLLMAKVAIAPTLKLLNYELQKERVPEQIADRLVASTVENFKPFVAAGGTVIFGTDVGYMTDYDPTEEYVLMERAGMTPMRILASLTTEPAHLWNEATRRGRIEVGMDADLVVLGSDPAQDVRRFADVRCSIRGGKVIYRRQM